MPQPVAGVSKKCSNSGPRVGRGPKSTTSSTSPPVACPQGSLWDLLSEEVSSSVSQKITCLLSWWGLGDQACLSWGLPQEQLWPWGHQCLVLSASQLSLPMFSSKMWGPLAPFNVPKWLPGGPYQVGHPSPGFKDGVQSGGWAGEWAQQPPVSLPLVSWFPFSLVGSPSGRKEYP